MIFVPDELRSIGPKGLQVCEKLLRGESEKSIAVSLTLSVHTVHAHVKRIYRAACVNSQRELAAIVIERLMLRVDQLETSEPDPGPGDTLGLTDPVRRQMMIGIDQHGAVATISTWPVAS